MKSVWKKLYRQPLANMEENCKSRFISTTHLGPAENGTKENGSMFLMFSGENLSGLKVLKSSPQITGLLCRL